ncbi:hypothetical protein RM844_07955 [Streptomyces sp. DSM 44915]|uniref:Integral membrane protein n=1 Tax=Streptomyces chisholmiae TaxID=3075540 RepID=A0ABU2JMU4_9ACTN|nr:hypothetical protein [Streptomyces sp. DSM 44915]MDT0266227.1 hypothetical protein [Streptomyces sp. DSM 44915]
MSRPRHARTGTEPITALSALRLRLLLSAVFTPLFIAGAVVFGVWWGRARPGDAVSPDALRVVTLICVVCAVFALVDLLVVLRRRQRAARRPAARREG